MSDQDDLAPDTPGRATPFSQAYLHGTRAELAAGDCLEPGRRSNYGQRREARWVYLSATLDAAVWGAELAQGAGVPRIYLVEATGPIEDDPNLTDRRFPGNPSRSFRTAAPLRVVGEVTGWIGHREREVATMRETLARLDGAGVEAVE